jgi:hypothetical protein
VAKLLKDTDPRYRALPGTAWSKAQGVDRQHQGPHDVQRAATTRSVALTEAASDGMTSRKVFTQCFHGPQHTRLTRSKAPARSEEGR